MTKQNTSSTFQFPEVRVVEASAGSGKTFALAKRYVQLLLNPNLHFEHIPIRNILAITFTNKAAFEMKARILHFLKLIALGQIPKELEQEILKPIGINPDQAKRKAYAIMEDLIHHYNFFQVQTIDKFINALLSGCAFKVGLTANFRIKTNSREYLEYSLDQLIDQASDSRLITNVFDRFLHNYLYLENRTGWFPKEDMLSIILSLYMQNNAYGLDFHPSSIKSEDVIKHKAIILEQMKSLRELLPETVDKRFLKSFDNFLVKHQKSFDMDSISDYFVRESVPVKKNTEVSADIDSLWESIRKGLNKICEEEACSLFNPYIKIYEHVKDGFLKLSAQDDVLFLEQLNKRAGLLFDDDYITVEELYYRLATRFHHYLIDEFQDTSRLQWHNIEKMAEEALSTGGSLFYVGDRKQAIYGFRGGEVELFDEIKQGFNSFNIQNEFLNNNWRSQKAIVEFNNAIFNQDNLRRFILEKENYESEKKKKNPIIFSEGDYKELDRAFEGAQQKFQAANADGYVSLEHVDVDKKDERDSIIREKLIELIQNLNKRFTYGEIAILTRGNHEIEQITNWLLEEGIQVESERTSNIQENDIIAELISFLKFLNSPIDNVAFAQFIIGDVFSKATGLSSEQMHQFLFSLRDRMHKEKDFYIYREFRHKYAQQWDDFIAEFFQNVGLYPMYELVVSIYHRFECLRYFPDEQGFLMHFLELIKKQEDEHADLTSFINYFEQVKGEDLYVQVTDADTIKLTTIHKSKGLEYPVVILPFIGMDIQIGASSDNRQSYILQKSPQDIELLRLKGKYLGFSDHLYQIYNREYKRSLFSELNSLYVALTRAQHELYGFVPKRIGNSFNLARFLIPEDLFQIGKQKTYKSNVQKKLAIKRLPVSQYHNWIEYLKDEFLDYDEVVQRDLKLKGEIVHYMLSFVGNLANEDINDVLNVAVKETELCFPNIEYMHDIRSIVEELIHQEAMRPIFFVDEGEVLMEQEVINKYGHSKRLDRLVVKEDQAWIVDYKSSKDAQGRDITQVQEYCELIQAMYPNKEVKGFIIYLDQMESVEVHKAEVVQNT